jgi:hypothetical protein
MNFFMRLTMLGWLLTLPALAFSSDAVPPCMARGQPIPINNAQALQWKKSTPNQYTARSHVTGRVLRVYPNQSDHNHFSLQVGPGPRDTIEVIYNIEFGQLPPMAVGMEVEACGDFINSFAQAGPYPPSPDGAIIHWVHYNPNGKGHDSGFLVIDGMLYGYPHQYQFQNPYQHVYPYPYPHSGR